MEAALKMDSSNKVLNSTGTLFQIQMILCLLACVHICVGV